MQYDVIIIGARVAGSILASVLGERGYRVLVLDRSKFPSDTISTHFFRAPALRAFNKIGILKEVESAAPQLRVNFNVIDGIRFPEPVNQPEDYPYYMCVRRIVIDDILVGCMKQKPSVELREVTTVTGLVWNNDTVTGVKWKKDGQTGTDYAKVIVGADGVNSFLAKEVKAAVEHQEPVNRAMYYAYYRKISKEEGPAAEFHYKGNTLVYCFPCDSELTLVAASIPVEQFPLFKKNLDEEFNSTINSMVVLAPKFREAEREGPIKGSGNIPGWLRIPYGKGWALTGDAGMIMDPWSGQGIDQASTHSLFLAESLDEYLSGSKEWANALNTYHQKRNEYSLKTYQRTCRYSKDLRPMTAAALAKRGLS
jgi:flavin-dependent dehydrogenase